MNNQIGEYSILRLLGKGATAYVYLCKKNAQDPVAVKWLHEENPFWVRRFQLECITLKNMSHPNIPRFIAKGKHDGRSYLVMEYISGLNGEIIAEKSQKLPPSERHKKCLQIGIQIAAALWSLHQKEIIHRDVKPSNLMVSNDNKAVLLDFGTLKDHDHDFTLSGQFIGTPRYASPEQLEGKKLSFKSDQFSLGATLYYLLVHRRPFPNEERTEFTAPSAFDPSIPTHLEEVILRLLALDPKDRFKNMLDVQQAFSTEPEIGSPLAGRERLLATIAQSLTRAGQGEQLVISLNGCRGIGKNWVAQTIKQGARRQSIDYIELISPIQFEKAQKLLTKRTSLLLITRQNQYQNFGIPVINIDITFLSLAEIRRSVHGYAPKTIELSIQSERLHHITGGLPALLLPLLERYTKNQKLILPSKISLPETDSFFQELDWEDIAILSTLALSQHPIPKEKIERISNILLHDHCESLEQDGLIRQNRYGWFCSNQAFADKALLNCADLEILQENIRQHSPHPVQNSQTYEGIIKLAALGELAKAKQEILSQLEKNISHKHRTQALLTAGQIFLDIGDHEKANRYLSDTTALAKSQNLWEYHAIAHAYRARISLEKHGSNHLGASLAIDRLLPIIKKSTHPIIHAIWSWALAALGDKRAWTKSITPLFQKLERLSPIDKCRAQFYLIQGFAVLGDITEAEQLLEQSLKEALNFPLLHWELKRAHSVITGTSPPITGPLAYNLSPTEIFLLKKRWIYVKGKSPDPTWKD